DLPFPIKDIPDKFNIFRKKIERESTVRAAWETPSKVDSPLHLESTNVPELNELGYHDEDIKNHTSDLIVGGEENGLNKLKQLLDGTYVGEENFTLISPYIAVGALSPIYVYHQMQESNLSQNKKKYERLMIKLFWRDYFRFMLKKYPNIFFKSSDITPLEINEKNLANWKNGTTGEYIIDNLIKKLKEKGNLNYSARRLVSKYFLQEVGTNWLIGAAFFEEYLLDYAPASTYGFWSHLAGSGTSIKENTSPNWQDQLKRFSYI
ncbi:MAG: FAD-binding domain-containing protein, partial [Sphingobacterium sp.]